MLLATNSEILHRDIQLTGKIEKECYARKGF